MRSKKGWIGILAALMAPSLAWADMHMGKDTRVGIEYRGELTYDDHELQKFTGNEPAKTTEIDLKWIKATLDHDIMDGTSFHFRYAWGREWPYAVSITNVTPAPVPVSYPEYAYLSHKLNDQFSLDLGRMKILQGGYETMNNEFDSLIRSIYTMWGQPFKLYDSAIAVHFHTVGRVPLQLVNDVPAGTTTTGFKGYKTTAHKQPAFILQYWGDFNGSMPLLQYGSYDTGRSNFVALGVGFMKNNVSGWVDYVLDTNKDTADKEHKATNMSLRVSYDMGSVEPFLGYVTTDIKQDPDVDGNTFTGSWVSATNFYTGDFTDNFNAWVLGTYFMKHGKSFRPFFAVIGQGAKMFKDANANSTETRSGMMLKVGVNGKI